MWEEIAAAENLDSKLWPRLAAIAERLWSAESVTDVASMYRRLSVVNTWLEWLDLRQCSGLRLMRQRLAGRGRSASAGSVRVDPGAGEGVLRDLRTKRNTTGA
jgi:hypothetical protein